MKQLIAAASLALLTCSVQASPLVVYSNTYGTPFATAPGVTATHSAGGATIANAVAPFDATYGAFLRNRTDGITSVQLINLPIHTALDINFTALFLDSWDSTNGSPAPDFFQVLVDNVVLASFTVNNASGSVSDFGGGTPLALYTQFDDNVYFSDSVVDMGTASALSFSHSASSVTVGIRAFGAGLQFGTDESWGLDNMQIVAETPAISVPEPATYPLVAIALLGAAAGARRRRA